MSSIDFKKEQKREHILRDVRTPTQRFRDSLLQPKYPYLWLATSGVLSAALMPVGWAFALGGGLMIKAAIQKQRKAGLPCSYPKSSKKLDPKNGWKPAMGTFYCGTDRHTGKELWIDAEQFKRHSFFFGTTGSGKTEFLLSVMLNSLIQGSSFVFIDGKGDIKLYYSSYSQARILGREHDILLLNFLTGEKDIIGAQDSKISNRFNYFGAGNSDAATQTTNSIIDAEDDIWGKRASSFVESLMKPLVFKRSEFGINLDAEVVRSYFSIHQLERLFLIDPFLYEGLSYTLSGIKNYFVNLPDWSITRSSCYEEFLTLIANPKNEAQLKIFKRMNSDLWLQIKDDFDTVYRAIYVENTPDEVRKAFEGQPNNNNQPAKGKGQASETMLQHGYITMQLVQVFNSLADTYGYIMKTSCPDIDMRDVILHRRILIALLPALAKSPSELKNLGRIILSVIKTAMTTGLGYKAEGDVTKIIDTRPTDAENPIPIVADECGVYLINGAFVLPAQGRSLGVGMVFAAQDITALLQNLDQETYSILGNTVNKFCGKLDDKESAEYFENLAGEGKFAVLGGFEKNSEDGHSFKQSNQVNLESLKRVSFNDLRSHTAGHWHYFFGNDIFYIQSFYANTKTVRYLRVNHFLEIASIGSEEFFSIKRVLDQMLMVVDKRTESKSTFSKYIDRYLKSEQTLAKERDAELREGAVKDVLPRDNSAASALIAQSLHNHRFNQPYLQSLKYIIEKHKRLEDTLVEKDIGCIEYNPFSYPSDLNFEIIDKIIGYSETEDMKRYNQLQLNTDLTTSDIYGNPTANNVFTHEMQYITLSAGISGKQFLAITQGQKNAKVIKNRVEAFNEQEKVAKAFATRNANIGAKIEMASNPELSLEDAQKIAEKAQQVAGQEKAKALSYSLFKEDIKMTNADIVASFESICKMMYDENQKHIS